MNLFKTSSLSTKNTTIVSDCDERRSDIQCNATPQTQDIVQAEKLFMKKAAQEIVSCTSDVSDAQLLKWPREVQKRTKPFISSAQQLVRRNADKALLPVDSSSVNSTACIRGRKLQCYARIGLLKYEGEWRFIAGFYRLQNMADLNNYAAKPLFYTGDHCHNCIYTSLY